MVTLFGLDEDNIFVHWRCSFSLGDIYTNVDRVNSAERRSLCGAEALFPSEVFAPDIGHVRERQAQLIENVGSGSSGSHWGEIARLRGPRLYALTR